MSKEKKQVSTHDEFHLENSVYYTEVPDSFKNRKPYNPPNEKLLTAGIPGTIMEVFIKEGQKLDTDDPVLILEAMKMRNKVNSALQGTVKKIHVKTGDIVRKGALLIEYI